MQVTEGTATITASDEEKISKDLDVFYNPAMQTNRDLSLILLQALDKKALLIADPLAGSGIRTIRFLKELPAEMIKEIYANDIKQSFPATIEENMTLSKLGKEAQEKTIIQHNEANLFLLQSKSFDYIDIDPFGSPNPFLDAASRRIKRGGILAVTATDTAPLCGTYPKACKRKYWAKPRRDYLMHEYGLRILIRKCQLIAAQYDKALTPIFSYSKDHYFRIFFSAAQGKSKVDEILVQHTTIDGYGPLWTGQLFDHSLTKKMHAIAAKTYPAQEKFLELVAEEASMPRVGFHDIHMITKTLKVSPPKHETILAALKEKKIKAVRTHITPTGIKAECDDNTIKNIIKEIA